MIVISQLLFTRDIAIPSIWLAGDRGQRHVCRSSDDKVSKGSFANETNE